MNYYNDNDPFCVKWLKALIENKLIPDGEVDERSITEIKPKELKGFVQCHFFAGVGGWPIALRLAGWPENEPVFTGSCPCQPFSTAGKCNGIEDPRHLWPAFRWIIAQFRPKFIFGEQVAKKGGVEWMSGVQTDLEAIGYNVGACDLPACSIGAWHIRQRLYWVAYINGARWPRPRQAQSEKWRDYIVSSWESKEIPNSNCSGWKDFKRRSRSSERNKGKESLPGTFRRRLHQWEVEPNLVRVVHGLSGNSRAVSAYGRAIVPQIAAEFIKAFMEIL